MVISSNDSTVTLSQALFKKAILEGKTTMIVSQYNSFPFSILTSENTRLKVYCHFTYLHNIILTSYPMQNMICHLWLHSHNKHTICQHTSHHGRSDNFWHMLNKHLNDFLHWNCMFHMYKSLELWSSLQFQYKCIALSVK